MSIESSLSKLEQKAWRDGRSSSPTIAKPEDLDIIRFSYEILRVKLYPGQALLLKLITVRPDLLTEWDQGMLAEWSAGFTTSSDGDGVRYVGGRGLCPDWLHRLEYCRDLETWNFPVVQLVLGRRASKSFLTAIVVAWRLWRLLALGDPHAYFRLPKGKRITNLVFSTNRGNSERDQFGDAKGLILNAERFQPFIDRVAEGEITFFTWEQLQHGPPDSGDGLIELAAASTTHRDARGPAVFSAALDEMAHVDGMGSTSDARQIAQAVEPAMAQFHREALLIMASSPSSMLGHFYETYLRACAVDPATRAAVHQDILMVQLPSWELYRDWEISETIDMWPNGPTFGKLDRPPIAPDDPVVTRMRLSDPRTHDVEYLAQFASSHFAFFNEGHIKGVFGPFPGGEVLEWTQVVDPKVAYVMHIDTSESNDNTVLVIAHSEGYRSGRWIRIDLIKVWRPSDYGGRLPPTELADEIALLITRFDPVLVTLDGPDAFRDLIIQATPQPGSRYGSLTNAARIRRVKAHAGEKLQRYLNFAIWAIESRVRSPMHQLARDEMRALVRIGERVTAPTSGQCKTDDIIDSFTWIVYWLELDAAVRGQFSDSGLTGAPLPGDITQRPRGPFGPNPYGPLFGRGRTAASEPFNPARMNPAERERWRRRNPGR